MKKEGKKHAGGRPSDYSVEITNEICDLIASGKSLLKICELDHMPSQPTVFSWLHKHEEFLKKYAKARESWADAEFEAIFQIADNAVIGTKTVTKETKDGTFVEVSEFDMVERAKLRVDTRKWALARMSPKKYGDKIEHVGDKENPISHKITVGDELAEILTLEQLEKVRERVLAKSNPS